MDSVIKNGLINQLGTFRVRISRLDTDWEKGNLTQDEYAQELSAISAELDTVEKFVTEYQANHDESTETTNDVIVEETTVETTDTPVEEQISLFEKSSEEPVDEPDDGLVELFRKSDDFDSAPKEI